MPAHADGVGDSYGDSDSDTYADGHGYSHPTLPVAHLPRLIGL